MQQSLAEWDVGKTYLPKMKQKLVIGSLVQDHEMLKRLSNQSVDKSDIQLSAKHITYTNRSKVL